MNLESKKLFNRELSWIQFNARVLAEGMDPSVPLLERLKFVGIVSSNFDEFFMVRMAGLEQGSDLEKEVREDAYKLIVQQNDYFQNKMVPELEAAGIMRVMPQTLTEKQFEFLRALFHKELFPVLTPVAVANERKIPMLVNLSLYWMVSLIDAAAAPQKRYAVIEVPKNFPRMVSLPADKGYCFILLEDVIALFAKELFSGYEITGQGLFRITRTAEMSLDEGTDNDFAEVMTRALQERRSGGITRLEISASKEMQEVLLAELKIAEEVLCPISSWMELKSISHLAFQPIFEELKRPAWVPKAVPEFENAEDIWDLLKEKDIAVLHPYQSFDVVTRFIAEAASDPDVLAIKQTLYRAGQDSSIIASLERAAQKGKNVTVLVELKARFDEEKNISWAQRLEMAGASVIYGLVGLKTHAKACLVVRREPEGIKRYMHLGTGNYNEKTSHIYSDVGLFTANEEFAQDITSFFNIITGYSQPTSLSKLVVAPFSLRRKLKQLITREVLRSTKEKPGLIMAKMNSLLDEEIINSLYQASKAGVKIKLNVRGVCALRPGIKDLSENIEVVSIVDMFLEHARMLYFQNGGDEELYLSSADWMPRNLDRRIELLFPVENKDVKKELTEVLQMYFKDNQKSWKLLPNGDYEKIEHGSDKKFRVQETLLKRFSERASTETKPKELKPQKPRH